MACAPAAGAGADADAPRPSTLRIWLLAARPSTLPAALAGVVVGLGAALGAGAAFRPDTALGCVAVALLLQVVATSPTTCPTSGAAPTPRTARGPCAWRPPAW